MGYQPKHSLRRAVTRAQLAGRTAVFTALTGGLAIGGFAVASGASAQITASSPLYVTANGEAGYGTSIGSSLGNDIFSNIQAVITPNQYGTTVQGGALGVQLTTAPLATGSHAGDCYAAQFGLEANTATSTYTVEDVNGYLPASASPIPDCISSGVVSIPAGPVATAVSDASLSSAPNDDSYWVSLTYVQKNQWYWFGAPGGWWGSHRHHYHASASGLVYSVENLSVASPTVTTVFVPDPHNFVHASFGISADNVSDLKACAPLTLPGSSTVSPIAYTSDACQEVAEFDYATVSVQTSNGHPVAGLQNVGLDNSQLTPDMAIDGTGSGSSAAAMIDTHDSLSDSSPVVNGSLLANYQASLIKGASATGNSFQVFTADSIG